MDWAIFFSAGALELPLGTQQAAARPVLTATARIQETVMAARPAAAAATAAAPPGRRHPGATAATAATTIWEPAAGQGDHRTTTGAPERPAAVAEVRALPVAQNKAARAETAKSGILRTGPAGAEAALSDRGRPAMAAATAAAAGAPDR